MCHRRFLKPVALSIFSPAPATPAHPCPALCQVPPVSQALSPFAFFLSCARGPVQACPGLGPAGLSRSGRRPVASRRTVPAYKGRDRGGRDQPTRRPARPTGQGAKLLRMPCIQGILSARSCTYEHWAVSRRCGVVPTSGAPPAGPPTPTYPASHTHSTPTAGGQTSRALESKFRSN